MKRITKKGQFSMEEMSWVSVIKVILVLIGAALLFFGVFKFYTSLGGGA